MIDDIKKMLDRYMEWVKDKTTLRQVEEWVEITTPYLDRHNDYLQIYAKADNGGYILTDDGYTISDLEQSGCKLNSPKRKQLLEMTLNGFGIRNESHKLEVNASPENFALRKHNLIQAILAVNDLFYLSESNVKNLFFEDVVAWLDINNIRYTPKVKFTGKTGYDHMFDFVIPKSQNQPERIIRALNNPNKDAVSALVLSWFDTRTVRPPDARAYAILNDAEREVPHSESAALKSYGVTPIPWRQRDKYKDGLVA